MSVTLVKQGVLVTMTGVPPELLALELSYTHRETDRVVKVDKRTGHTYVQEIPKFTNVRLFAVHGKSVIFQSGLLDRVTRALTKRNISFTIEDKRKTTPSPDWDSLRKYYPALEFRNQQDILLGVFNALDCGQLVAPTGFGKTFCIKLICALYPKANIVVAMPGADLVRDTHEDFVNVFGEKQVARMGAGSSAVSRITVSTFRSLHKISPMCVDFVLVDEAHNVAAKELSRSLSKFVNLQKIFGFTATPMGRCDNAELVTESVVGPVRMKVEYTQAVDHESVVPVTVVFANVTSGPEDHYKQAVTRKRHLYWRNTYRNKLIAACTDKFDKELGGDQQILILVDRVIHLQELAKFMPEYALVYKSPGKTKLPKIPAKQLSALFDDFKSGKVRKVIATGCWGTGVDFPGLNVVVMASGCSSIIETSQRAGRVTRLAPGKERGYILDFDDKWTEWTAQRAGNRRRVYRKNAWDIK